MVRFNYFCSPEILTDRSPQWLGSSLRRLASPSYLARGDLWKALKMPLVKASASAFL